MAQDQDLTPRGPSATRDREGWEPGAARNATPYADMKTSLRATRGADVSKPQEGYFRYKLRSGSIAGGVHIFYGPPCDPVTGETMDRSWRWQASFDGDPIDFDRVWPACTGQAISHGEYQAYVARRLWARTNAPSSAYAESGRKHDPLSVSSPLPF